jgi:hypothetical protein
MTGFNNRDCIDFVADREKKPSDRQSGKTKKRQMPHENSELTQNDVLSLS